MKIDNLKEILAWIKYCIIYFVLFVYQIITSCDEINSTANFCLFLEI